jgi:hypothetical protein
MTGGHGQESLLLRPLPTKLPKVEFWKIKPKQPHPRGVDDPLYHKFGYNDIDEVWQPSPTYTRWVQPSQEELAHQVEYDMTDADQIWLDTINAERKKEGLDMITYEFFEIIMDKLEKEWFDLQKHFPKPASNLLVEDSKCTICDDGECEASNAIVFCDGCNLAVHQGKSHPSYCCTMRCRWHVEKYKADRLLISPYLKIVTVSHISLKGNGSVGNVQYLRIDLL